MIPTDSSTSTFVVKPKQLPDVYAIAADVFGVAVDLDEFLREIDRQTKKHRHFEYRVLQRVGFGGKIKAYRLVDNRFEVWFDCYREDGTERTAELFAAAHERLRALAWPAS